MGVGEGGGALLGDVHSISGVKVLNRAIRDTSQKSGKKYPTWWQLI